MSSPVARRKEKTQSLKNLLHARYKTSRLYFCVPSCSSIDVSSIPTMLNLYFRCSTELAVQAAPIVLTLHLDLTSGRKQKSPKLGVLFPGDQKPLPPLGKDFHQSPYGLSVARPRQQSCLRPNSRSKTLSYSKNKSLLEGGFEPPAKSHKEPSCNLAQAFIVQKLRTIMVNIYCSESTGSYSGSGSGTGHEANPRLLTNLSNVLNGKIASDLN